MGLIDCLQRDSPVRASSSRTVLNPCFAKRVGVQDLVSTAGGGRKRNQNIGFSESQNSHMELAPALDRDQIGGSEQMPERFIHIFILNIAPPYQSGFRPDYLCHRYV